MKKITKKMEKNLNEAIMKNNCIRKIMKNNRFNYTKGYKIDAKELLSIGELIDRLCIINLKIWHLDTAMSEAANKIPLTKTVSDKNALKAQAGDYAIQAREQNAERTMVREMINKRLEGKSRGTDKLEYTKGVGR